MRQAFQLPIGQSKRGMTLPDGTGAWAIQVDNPSGSWLAVYPGNVPIAPSTLGAIVSFGGEAPSVDVLFSTTGPAAYIVSAVGDPVTVTLFSEDEAPDGSAEGYQYQGPLPPLVTALFAQSMSALGPGGAVTLSTVLLGGSTTKHLRVYSYFLGRAVSGLKDRLEGDYLAAFRAVGATTPDQLAQLEVNANRQTDRVVWSPPLDLALGTEVRIDLYASSVGATADVLGVGVVAAVI